MVTFICLLKPKVRKVKAKKEAQGIERKNFISSRLEQT